MTNDNKPQDVSKNPCKDLPEGAVAYDHTKYNKDQKLRMLLSAFSQGLQKIGQLTENIMKLEDNHVEVQKISETIFTIVDQSGMHGRSIMGGGDPDFHDDDVTGADKRRYIPVAEIKTALRNEYKLGGTSCDDEVNETLDNCLTALGFDITEDE